MGASEKGLQNMTEKVTLCWLDGFNQYRSRTIERKIRSIPNDVSFYFSKGWPLHYTHMIRYYGQCIPAHDYNHPDQGAGPKWWAFSY